MTGRFARWVRAAEESPRNWLPLLAGWILSRNWLEGVLERPRQMGFDWREEISFPMYFLHFPLFYLALFVLVCLWLHLLTSRPLPRVARAVSLAYAVLLVAPIVDFLVSGGRGYDLKYLLGLGPVLWRFWNPAASVSQLSPGQRIEILLACLLGAAYVFGWRRSGDRSRPDAASVLPGRSSRARSLATAIAAAAGIYLLAALLGSWPSLFARLVSANAPSLGDAYRRTFQLGGLLPSESRRLAVVMALPLLAVLPAFLWRWNGPGLHAVVRDAGWTRPIYYTGLVPAGAWLGWIVYHPYLQAAFTNGSDYAAVITLWGSMAAAFLASLCWNDLHDEEADGINAPHRPIPSGRIDRQTGARLALYSAAAALFLALCVSYQASLLVLACLFLSWLYSAPPLRLKRWPVAATATLGALSLLSAFTGFSLFAAEMTPRVFPERVGWLLFLGVTLGFNAKDLKDRSGDRASGVATLATLLPERWARLLVAALIAAGYALAPVLLPLGPGFTVQALAFGAGSVIVTLRLRRPDSVLLLGFAAFALAVLGFLTFRPEFVRERIPQALRREHALLLGFERSIRDAKWTGSPYADAPARDRDLLAAGDRDLLAAAARDDILRERAAFDLARTAPPAEAVPMMRGLLARRPLSASYWDALLEVASAEPESARAVCSRAIVLGVRPGDFLRNRAAATLSLHPERAPGGAERAGPGHDLGGAFLFGQKEALLHVLLGDLAFREGDAEHAADAYRTATAIDPDLAEAWAGLGEARHGQRRYEEALLALEKAASLSPADPWIRNNLGVVLRDAGRLPQARAAFEQAHRLAPGLFEPVYNLGLTAERMGLVADARRWYGEARRIRSGFPPLEEAWRRLGGETGR